MLENEYSPSAKQIFLEKLSQLMNYSGAELKHKIEEMNILVDEMNNEEIKDIFNKELFDKINEMIEEEKLSMENTLLLLKRIGYCKVLFGWWIYGFHSSLLCGRFEKMIEEEEKKEEEKDETLLVNLCECYLSLHHYSSEIGEIISIIVPCLLNIALNKKESEEAQNEVEIALLALSCIDMYREMEPKLHLNEIREIIKHHQEHHNLTQLAYQSAWLFLINRLFCNGFLEDIVVNELHFGREAARELEELTKCVNWKKKEEEMSKEEAKEEFSLMRWVETLNIYFGGCQLQNEEFVKILSRIVQVHRAAKENYSVISNRCIYVFQTVVDNSFVKIESLLKGRVVDVFLEEIHQPTLNDNIVRKNLKFFLSISLGLKEEAGDEMEEARRKSIKMEIFEKMEEEGYEDCIVNLNNFIQTMEKFFFRVFNILEDNSNYFVYL